MVFFGGFFAKLGRFSWFSLHIINFVGRINEVAMKGVGDIIFHNFGAQWKDTPSYCDFSGFISIVFAASAKLQGRGGVRGTLYDKNDKTGISFYNINFTEMNSEAAMGRGREYIL